MPVLYVANPWTIEIDARGVRITYRSGNDEFVRRMSRADYRAGIEASLAQLDAYDQAEARKVVPLRGRQRGH